MNLFAGVNTVLETPTNWRELQRTATRRAEYESVRITINNKGIAQVLNDLSNPHLCDPKSGALPGCAMPRLDHLKFHLSQQVFSLNERFGTMANHVFLPR